jgi:hypothetical protein
MTITNITPMEMQQARELNILRAALWHISVVQVNSDPDIMACTIDEIVATAQGALRKAQEIQNAGN